MKTYFCFLSSVLFPRWNYLKHFFPHSKSHVKLLSVSLTFLKTLTHSNAWRNCEENISLRIVAPPPSYLMCCRENGLRVSYIFYHAAPFFLLLSFCCGRVTCICVVVLISYFLNWVEFFCFPNEMWKYICHWQSFVSYKLAIISCRFQRKRILIRVNKLLFLSTRL